MNTYCFSTRFAKQLQKQCFYSVFGHSGYKEKRNHWFSLSVANILQKQHLKIGEEYDGEVSLFARPIGLIVKSAVKEIHPAPTNDLGFDIGPAIYEVETDLGMMQFPFNRQDANHIKPEDHFKIGKQLKVTAKPYSKDRGDTLILQVGKFQDITFLDRQPPALQR